MAGVWARRPPHRPHRTLRRPWQRCRASALRRGREPARETTLALAGALPAWRSGPPHHPPRWPTACGPRRRLRGRPSRLGPLWRVHRPARPSRPRSSRSRRPGGARCRPCARCCEVVCPGEPGGPDVAFGDALHRHCVAIAFVSVLSRGAPVQRCPACTHGLSLQAANPPDMN